MTKIAQQLLQESKKLSDKLNKTTYPDTIFVYNVLDYAWEGWQLYINNYARSSGAGRQKYLLLGINPGPHGMVQTGVPFGNINAVKHYLNLQHYTVKQPKKPHPKRPIKGLMYHREEKSGERVWGCIKDIFPHAKDFFKQAFILNFCPLAFFDLENANNLTPDHALLRNTKSIKTVELLCKEHLIKYCTVLKISNILAIGRYSYNIAKKLVLEIGIQESALQYIPHPSPLNFKHKNFDIAMHAIFR